MPRLVRWLAPSRRPMDNMAAGYDRPQEDEFEMCLLGQQSPYLTIAFPNRPTQPVETLDLDGLPVVSEIADRHGATTRQVVLAWLLARSPAMLPIPGTRSVAHLESNIAATRVELALAEVAAITQQQPTT